MIGQTLNQRYQIAALLGEGAMGEVYRAADRQTGTEVAVKVITQKLGSNPEMLERFRREGEALRQLRHSNIVAFVEMFPLGQQYVIVMEYVPGGSLHSLIKRGPLPLARAVRIALELSDALARAHHIDIIHRDIKPENVLLADDGTPKLTDFGVARLLDETARLTGTRTQIGTPYYMSPEAWEGRALDPQTDVWSLGVVLYEMLTGRVPFAGDTLVAVMNKVLTAPLPDIRLARPEVPPALAEIVQRMLARNKAERYETMRQVAVDLEKEEREAKRAQAAARRTAEEAPQAPSILMEPDTRRKPEDEQRAREQWIRAEARRMAEAEEQARALSAQEEARLKAEAEHRARQQRAQEEARRAQAAQLRRVLAMTVVGGLTVVCVIIAGGLGWWAASGRFHAVPPPTAAAATRPPSVLPMPTQSTAAVADAAATAVVPAATAVVPTTTAVGPTATQPPAAPSIPPTAAPPTATPAPTLALPVWAGTPLPTLAQTIEPENANSLQELARWQTGAISQVAFSPDGQMLVTDSPDRTLRLWEAATGRSLRALEGPALVVGGLAFSPDSKLLALGSCSKFDATNNCAVGAGVVILWDTTTGQRLHTLTGHSSLLTSVAFSPDGKLLASGSGDSTVRLWDPATGQRLRTLVGHTYWITGVAFSPDGQLLASGSNDRTIRLWNPATGQLLRTLKVSTWGVRSIAFAPDGKSLAAGCEDSTLNLWDPATGQNIRPLTSGNLSPLPGQTSRAGSLAFSPDGKTLASAACLQVVDAYHCKEGGILLWDPATGQSLHPVSGHTDQVLSIAFSPDGKVLASASRDGTLRLWGVMK